MGRYWARTSDPQLVELWFTGSKADHLSNPNVRQLTLIGLAAYWRAGGAHPGFCSDFLASVGYPNRD